MAQGENRKQTQDRREEDAGPINEQQIGAEFAKVTLLNFLPAVPREAARDCVDTENPLLTTQRRFRNFLGTILSTSQMLWTLRRCLGANRPLQVLRVD